MSRWAALRLLLVLGVTAVAAGLVLRGIDGAAAWAALVGADWRIVPVFFLFQAAILLLRTWRFQLLLDAPVPFGRMLPAVSVSFLAINVVPLRLGELVRPWLLAEREGVPVGSALAAVVSERLLDLCAVGVLLGGALAWVGLPRGAITVGGFDVLGAGLRSVGGLLAIVGVAGLVTAWRGQGAIGRGLRALAARPGQAAAAAACTAGMQALTLACVALGLWSFEALEVSARVVWVSWAATLAGIALMPTPGFFGPFEAACSAALEAMGAPLTPARTFALTLHLLMFAFHLTAGLTFAAREGWSILEAVRESRGLGARRA